LAVKLYAFFFFLWIGLIGYIILERPIKRLVRIGRKAYGDLLEEGSR